MSELVELLADAFEEGPRQPADRSLPGSVEALAYWSFPPSLEVVVAKASAPVADGRAIRAWRARLDRRPIPLVLAIESADGPLVVGPAGDPPPVVNLDLRLVLDELAAARELDPLDVRRRLPEVWELTRGAAGLAGLRNVSLFSAHYLRARAPQLPDWDELAAIGRAALSAKDLSVRLDALDFESEKKGEGIYVLRSDGRPAAAVLSYPAGRDLDRAASGGDLPVAGLLREMDAVGAEWGVLASGEVWRLYSATHPARTTSFAEVDLAKLADPAYIGALFSARALRRGGLAETIASGSRDFAVALGDRLRDRIYVEVVPLIARAIGDELERLGEPAETQVELEAVYDATLTLLYRLLFVLYAEAREYLPVGASAAYRDHSLRNRIEKVIATIASERDFDPGATDIWNDLCETFDAVASGHTEWGVPPYDGGLFEDDGESGADPILARVRPTNAGLGRALYHLAVDTDEGEGGLIDYADLDIRHLGDMYEGLLQFGIERAAEDLAYSSAEDAYFSAGEDDAVAVTAGQLYLRSAKGGRKASGTFYTPQSVVRYVVEQAVVPAFDRHLEAVAAIAADDQEAAARELWQFRICDAAMGSGHFLVDALDVLTDRIAHFLAETPLKPVRAVLGQLREMVQAQAKDLPPGALRDIRDVELLKRVVLKRLIYGVDRNAMAVELAKLALWLDAFVPGLPLSYLDHNLRCGDSLVGVAGDEVLDALQPREATLEESWVAESLRAGTERALEAVGQVEARLQDVEAAREAEHEREQAVAGVVALYNRWTAEGFGLEEARARIGDRHTLEAEADERDARRIAAERSFFHWPLAFPEVCAGGEGFDVVLGNPPWDKVRFEREHHWVSRFPGLNALSDREREVKIEELRKRYPREAERERRASEEAEAMQSSFSGEYSLQGTHGHLDLAKLFLERAFALAGAQGSIGLVLPRQFLVLRGWLALRSHAFEGAECSVVQLSNRGSWVFPDVHARYMFALLGRHPSDGPGELSLRGGVDRPELMPATTGLTLHWTIDEMREFSEVLAVPELPRSEDAELFAKLVPRPRLADPEQAFGGVHSDTPYDWTDAGRRELVQRPPLEDDDYRVLQTRHVGHLRLDRGRAFNKGVAAKDARKLLERKWKRSRALAEELAEPPRSAEQAEDLYRVVYRYATMATNSRTLIPALMPRGFLAAKGYAHSAIPLKNDDLHRLALLGCLSTITADWWARRFVDRHVTSSVMRSIPAPDWDDEQVRAAAKIVARLACEPGDPALASVGLSDADLVEDEAERFALEAELELLYARAVGLDERDVAWMVESFNLEGVPAGLRLALGAEPAAEVAA
jgi:hypothetical protein